MELIQDSLSVGELVPPRDYSSEEDEDDRVDEILVLAEKKDWPALRFLIDNSREIIRYQWGLLYSLSEYGNIEEYSYWISKGLSLREPQATALRGGCKNGNDQLVLFLIEKGASLDVEEYVEDYHPIIHALRHCSLEVVQKMVQQGVDLHCQYNLIFDRPNEIWDSEYVKMAPRQEMVDFLSKQR